MAVFIGMLAVYAGMHYYLAGWLARSFNLSAFYSSAARYIFLLLAVMFPLAMYLNHTSYRGASSGFYYFSALWLGILLIWVATALACDVLCLLGRIAGINRPHFAGHAVSVLTLFLCAYAFYEGCRLPVIKKIEIASPSIPPELDGFTIVQVSDIHMRSKSDLPRFGRIVDSINSLNPDIAVFTGDLLDPGFECGDDFMGMLKSVKSTLRLTDIKTEVCPRSGLILSSASSPALKSGGYALSNVSKNRAVGVLGNHEFYSGLKQAVECYVKSGIKLLRNQSLTLSNGLQIAGIDDITAAGVTDGELEAVLKKLDASKPAVLLSHQPLKFQTAAQYFPGIIMLAGHTHKGQIFPFGFFVRIFYRYFYGLYEEGNAFLYVTSGAGAWGPPMRFFAPSEIPCFVLKHQTLK